MFVINNGKSMNVENAKTKSNSLIDSLYKQGYDLNVGVETYTCYWCDSESRAKYYTANGEKWAKNAVDAKSLINNISQEDKFHQTILDGLGMTMDEYTTRTDAQKVVVVITDTGVELIEVG